jgi:hypothetical protein
MMKRFALCLLLGGSVVVSLSRAAMPGWVQLKPAGSSDQAVAFATVQQVADARAKSSWPAAQSGDVIPCVDADGNAIAYVFHYRIDGASFPDYATAASEMTGEQTALDNPRNHSRYAHLFVSARYDRAPILRYGEGGDEFYYTLEPMRARAQGILGEPPTLTRIYYVWPLSFYEFTSGSQVVIIEATPPYRTFSSTEFQQYIRTGTAEAMSKATQSADASTIIASCASQMRAKWNRCLTATDGLDSVYVSDHMLSPFYNWSYGCSPTSGTMVVGYLDAARGLGRCIYDFFQRWDTVTHIIDWQIPHAQREMALDFNTDTSYGGTMAYNIPPGLNTFGSARGYGFDVISDGGNHANDYGWERDSMEISDNYPFVWSVSWQEH